MTVPDTPAPLDKDEREELDWLRKEVDRLREAMAAIAAIADGVR